MGIKNSIAKFLSLFGIGIYRINGSENSNSDLQVKPAATWKDFEIESPIKHNTPGRMDEFFSDRGMMEQYLGDERIKFYENIVQLAKEKKIEIDGKDIADAGCGTGHLLKFFTMNFSPKTISGMDFSNEALKIARLTLSTGNFFIYDLYKKPDGKFDVLLCTEVLEHLQHPEYALSNLLQMMRMDAVCIITVPNGRIDFYEGHINFWSPESWEIFITKNSRGFKTETGTLPDKKNNFAIIRSCTGR
ncbi:MAG: methyltransferase domain-containing protein [Ignavibacteria bacterium]